MLRRAKAREGSHLHLPMHSFRAGADSGEGGGVRNSELGRTGAVRPLWSEADNLRERVAEADALYGFFSFDTALSQRASHGHLRTSPAARAALIRLCAATNTRGAVLSARKVETLQRRLRLHRLAYVGVHGTDVQACGLRMVTEPDLERAETAVQKLRRACSRVLVSRAPRQACGTAGSRRCHRGVRQARLGGGSLPASRRRFDRSGPGRSLDVARRPRSARRHARRASGLRRRRRGRRRGVRSSQSAQLDHRTRRSSPAHRDQRALASRGHG
ncbi:MAG: hypothetical protein E6J82_15690 [Deltaproteobacteria bacterium]|nr:MAG: hypothetical protein E6J82_15690 [Deltaproteobacteria bacterium]